MSLISNDFILVLMGNNTAPAAWIPKAT
jgi:hypothetical protein